MVELSALAEPGLPQPEATAPGGAPAPAARWILTAGWVRLARWVLAGTVLAAVGLAAAGSATVGGLPLVTTAGVIALGAVGVGVFAHRRGGSVPAPAGRVEPWYLLAAGVAIILATSSSAVGRSAAHPASSWWVVASSLVGVPLIGLGLLRLVSGRIAGRDADVLVDAGLAATACGLAVWVVAVHPHSALVHHHLAEALLVVARPALDLGLVVLAGRLLLLPGERFAAYRYVALALAYQFGAHLLGTMSVVGAWQAPLPAVRVLLVCSFGFWGLAALDPSMRRLFEPLGADPDAFSPGHMVLVCGAMLVAAALIGIDAKRHVVVSPTVAIGAGLLAPVLAAYVANLLWDRGVRERQAQHDILTGLPNRTLFLDRLARAVAHAKRNQGTVGVLFIDLDRFKNVNDTFGHHAGDVLLQMAANRMREGLRDEDTVARLSGDEFGVLLPHVSDFDGVVTVTEKIVGLFQEPFSLAEERLVVTPSIGIAIHPQDGEEADELVASADTAMYRAKERGRNTYEIYSPALRTRAHDRLELEAALRRGLSRDELVLHYQPRVDLRSRRIVGAEALVRWEHPDRGLLLPGHFVPLAEQSGLVVAMGELVLLGACEQNRAWQKAGLPPVKVSVNVSARQFREGIVDATAAVLRGTGLDPRCLELELTESAAIESLDLTVAALEDLRSIGVGCSIDDFGTGYCGLKYLSRLPITALKIDQSFVQGMSVADASIVAAIIALGHSLGLKVVAEGVETPAQLACLVARGCDEVQGYLISQPVPAADFERLLREQSLPGASPVLHASAPPPPESATEKAPREADLSWLVRLQQSTPAGPAARV